MGASEAFDIEILPVPPETSSQVREQVVAEIEDGLRTNGAGDLLTSGQFRVQVRQNVPDGLVTLVLIQVASHVAKKAFDEIVWPRLRSRWEVRRTKGNGPDPSGPAGA